MLQTVWSLFRHLVEMRTHFNQSEPDRNRTGTENYVNLIMCRTVSIWLPMEW